MKKVGIGFSILIGLLAIRILGGRRYMKNIETIRVEPIEQKGSITIGYLPAGTHITIDRGNSYNDALRGGFSLLAEYIFGGNEKNESIAMTSPVLTQGDMGGLGQKKISFILPQQYSIENSPMPTDPRIQLQDIGKKKVAAYTFRGVASSRRVEKELDKFKRHLTLQRVEHTGEFILAQYQPQFYFPLLRTNKRIVSLSDSLDDKNTENILLSNEEQRASSGYAIATFAAGCFWCSEAFFQEATGVVDAVVGYAGGIEVNPTYEDVVSKKTSHREAVQVLFDPTKTSYNDMLDIFRKSIDPTDEGGQFVDRGFQYTTAIFYHDDDQKSIAAESKRLLDESGKYQKPIVSTILPYTTFYQAEEFHQDFYKNSKERYARYKNASGRPEYYDEFGDPIEKEKAYVDQGDDFLGENRWKDFEKPSEDKLREQLTSMQFRVTQRDGTEPPFANAFDTNMEDGIYVDIVSGEPLYSSLDKYDSGTGWPSFVKPIHENAVTLHTDTSLFQTRTEVRSVYADSHLGHVFADGPADRGGLRYCMNSAAMEFIPLAEMEEKGYADWMPLFEE